MYDRWDIVRYTERVCEIDRVGFVDMKCMLSMAVGRRTHGRMMVCMV